jgi:ribonuclease J
LVFQGGLGEFGLNFLIIETDSSALIVDCGFQFPEAEHLGIDVLIPDFAYLDKLKKKKIAIAITHAHEDHVGAVPFLLLQRPMPVYGTPYTLNFLREKCKEFELGGLDFRPIMPGDHLSCGDIEAEAIAITHSILQPLAFFIKTPGGTIYHSGDFKIDMHAPDDSKFDMARIREIGAEGVDLALTDSTNAERQGHTPSESTVGAPLNEILHESPGRVFVTLFSSHIPRLKMLLGLAKKQRRRVVFIGRSLKRCVNVAVETGLLHLPDGLILEENKAGSIPDKELLVLVTGTQGEPRSALAKLAHGQMKFLEIKAGDVVVHSGRIIPGNEKAVGRIINQLLRVGADVITAGKEHPVHVSGHASREELLMLYAALRPRQVVPVHGEYRMLLANARVAIDAGIPKDNVWLIENGATLFLDKGKLLPGETIECGKVYIDAESNAPVEDLIRADRSSLAKDGLLVPVVIIRGQTGKLDRPPVILTRGLALQGDLDAALDDCIGELEQAFKKMRPAEAEDTDAARAKCKSVVRGYFKSRHKQFPMIMPIVFEV